MSTQTKNLPIERRVVSDDGTESVTFLETAAETGGARTYVEAELAPGCPGTPLHVHTAYSEDFEVLEGVLHVEVDGRVLKVQPGEHAVVPIGAVHRFANPSDVAVRFRCALEPASRGFEEMQQIGAGLAADGRTRGDLPKDPRILGVMMDVSDTHLAGAMRALNPLLRVLGRVGRRQGLDAALRERYVRW